MVTQRAKQLNSSPGTGPQYYEFECLKDNYLARRDVGLTQGSFRVVTWYIGLRAQSPKYDWDQGSEEKAQDSEEWDQVSQGF